MATPRIVALEGDQTGQELLEQDEVIGLVGRKREAWPSLGTARAG